MPELPEVETIKNALSPILAGQHFSLIEIFIPVCRHPLAPLLDKELLDHNIISVRRRARYLVIELDNLKCLIIHFGMSGSIRVTPPDTPRKKHEHVIFHLGNGSTMRFDCPRRFGFVKMSALDSPGALPPELAGLGVEPLSGDFSGDFLLKAFANSRRAIKSAIMDNAIAVCIGNIYANEYLFLSGIHPLTPAGSLDIKQLNILAGHIRQTLIEAIRAGGTTIADFKSVDGSEGRFVQQLKIYGKDGLPCPCCGQEIHKLVIGGRSSFFCPRCQPL